MHHPALLWFIRLVFPKLISRALLYFLACPNFLLNMKKAFTLKRKGYKSDIGRSGGIRTHDLFHPKEALYQTEPRPDILGCCCSSATCKIILYYGIKVKGFLKIFQKNFSL